MILTDMRRIVAIILGIYVTSSALTAQTSAISPDERVFLRPDKDNYPETYFHFIGGNMSQDGLEADLTALSDAGVSGVMWFHGTGGRWGGAWPGTSRQYQMLTPEWEKMVGHLGKTADSLGVELKLQLCPGWSMAGGPWIEPENAMRRLVWSRTDVCAGSNVNLTLPQGQPSKEPWRDYRDIRVLAFPTPLGDTGTPLRPCVTDAEEESWKTLVEGTNPNPVKLSAGSRLVTTFTLPSGTIIRTLSFPQIGSFSKQFCYDPGVHVRLTARDSSGNDKVLVDADLPMSNWQDRKQPAEMEFACEEIADAVEYTFTLTNLHPADVKYVRFYSGARKNSWRGEAGWSLIAKEPFQQHTFQDPRCFVQSESIIDISDRMTSDGCLEWTAPSGDFPEGKWTVLRIGHVNMGLKNGPAPQEATGWECNKMNPKGLDILFSNYIGALQDGVLGGTAGGVLMDSWECRTQTWTENMEDEFQGICHYSMTSHLPALMGYVIDSQEETSRFLIDWRRCANRLYCDNFFARIADLSHQKGMSLQYETAGGDVVTMDALEYFKYSDVPMCEFWQPVTEGYVGDLDFKPIRPTASAAHLYGKPRVAAEAFTSTSITWDEDWQMLRDVANFHMAQGVSHIVFHTYTHNPQVGFLPPGSGFGKHGTPFLRGQTWWKYMPSFTTYFARTGYMLETGNPVVDVLWYLGDEVGHRPFQYTGNGKRQSGDIRFPEGIKYDYCNPDALLNRLSVKDGKIVTPEGIVYQVLWIPENERMLPETIHKIGELLRAGAKVIANAPTAPATLNSEKSRIFDDAVASVWGSARNGRVNRIGKGRLAVGISLEEALSTFGIKPRFEDGGAGLQWQERTGEGCSWYFVAAPLGERFEGTVELQGEGYAQWWDPVDGTVKPLKTKASGRMKQVRLDLAEAQSGFIVFRKDRPGICGQKEAFEKGIATGSVVPTEWTIDFPDGWGAPSGTVFLDELKAWKDLDISEEGKAFSGTVTYNAVFEMDSSSLDKDVVLDLGHVDMIADIKINGKEAGILWTEPYRIPIGELVREGMNTLTVDVTSTWYNRLVYDASLPENERKTWTTYYPASGSQLRDSGLMGPVVIKCY